MVASNFSGPVEFETSSDDPLTRGVVRELHEVFSDERTYPPPVGTGEDQYPTPVDYLLCSLAACQLSVLAQCLDKARVDEFRIWTKADITEGSDPELPEEMPQKSVIDRIEVELELEVPEKFESRAKRCLEVYDLGCVVGQSISKGIEYEPRTTLTVAPD